MEHGAWLHATAKLILRAMQCVSCGAEYACHLKAISTLEEGVAVTCDIAADFAMLCSNCHRMIHRCAVRAI
jgi:5-methylcytosine-specific restriction protein A